MTKVEKFFSYIGLDNQSINETQMLRLICLLGQEHKVISIVPNNLDFFESILDIYINAFETNSFKNLTEQQVIQCFI